MNYRDLLLQCRASFGTPPRSLGIWNRYFYLQVPRPAWCKADDGLSQFFLGLGSLLKLGNVVWGHVVQANQLMFQRSPHNCPGEMLYCPDLRRDIDPWLLAPIAERLYDLKGTMPRDPQMASIANYLTNERIRVFGLNVPPVLSGGLNCMVSTVYFKRQHLPSGRICSSIMPLIVAPENPRLAMILPERYWPEELLRIWTEP